LLKNTPPFFLCFIERFLGDDEGAENGRV